MDPLISTVLTLSTDQPLSSVKLRYGDRWYFRLVSCEALGRRLCNETRL